MILRKKNYSLFCHVLGEGSPFVAIHGGPGLDHTYLSPYLNFLADHFTLVYLDLLGHGKSFCSDLLLISHKTFIEDIADVQRKFNAKTIALFGHSYGAMVALEYAAAAPDKVSQLILCNSATGLRYSDPRVRLSPTDHAQLITLLQHPNPKSEDLKKRLIFTFANYLYDLSVEKAERLMREITTNETVFRHIRINEYPKFDVNQKMKQISARTLVITGKHDALPLENSYLLARGIKDTTLKVFEKSGHFPFFEEPEVFQNYIETWLLDEY